MTNLNNDINLYRITCFLSDSDAKNYKSVINSIIFEFIYDNNNKPVSIADSKKYILNKFKLNINTKELGQIIQNNSSYVLHDTTEPLKIELKEEKIREIKHNLSENPINRQIDQFLKKNNLPTDYITEITDLLEQSIFENISSLSKLEHEHYSNVLRQNQTPTQSDLFEIYNQFLDQCDSDTMDSIMDLFVKATEFAILTSGRGVREITKDIFKGKTYLLDTNVILMLLGIGGNEKKDSISHTISKAHYQGINFQYTLDTEREFNRRVDAFATELKQIKNFNIIKNEQKKSPYLDEGFLKLFLHNNLDKTDPISHFIKKLKYDMKNLRETSNISPYNGDVSVDENPKDFLELVDQIVSHKKNNNNNTKSISSIERAARVDAKNITLVRKLRGKNNYNYSDIKSFYLTNDLALDKLLKCLNYNKETMIETFTPIQLFLCHNSLSTEHENEDYETFKIYLKRKNISESLLKGREVCEIVRVTEKYTMNPEVIKDILKGQVNEKAKDPKKYNHKSTIESIPKKIELIQKKHQQDSQRYLTAFQDAEKLFPKDLNFSKILVRIIDIFFYLAPTILLYLSTKNKLSILIIFLCLVLDYFFNKIFKWHKKLVKYLFKIKTENSPYSKVYKDNNKDYIEKSNSFFEKKFIKLWSK